MKDQIESCHLRFTLAEDVFLAWEGKGGEDTRGANSHTDRSLRVSSVFGETAPVDCVTDL